MEAGRALVARPPSPPLVRHPVELTLAALLVAVPLAFDPRAGLGATRPKYLLLLVGGGASAVLLLGLHRRDVVSNPLCRPVAAMLVVAAVSAAVSAHRRTALSGFPGSHDGLWSGLALAAAFFAAGTLAFPRVERLLVTVWFAAGGGVLLFGLAQLVDRLVAPGGWNWARPAIAPSTIGSTLGNPNDLAGFLAVLLPVGVVLAVRGSSRVRAAVLASGAVAVVQLGVTASRGARLAAAAGLVTLAALLRPPRAQLVRVTGAGLGLVVVALLAAGAAGVAKRDLAGVGRLGTGSTADLRGEVWSAALRVARDHPLLGVGPDVFPVVFPAYASERFAFLFGPFTVANGAHNVFLNTLANQGTVGLLALLAVLGTAALELRRRWSALPAARRTVLAGVVGGLVADLVQACFNTQDLSLSLLFWVLLGLSVSVASDR